MLVFGLERMVFRRVWMLFWKRVFFCILKVGFFVNVFFRIKWEGLGVVFVFYYLRF